MSSREPGAEHGASAMGAPSPEASQQPSGHRREFAAGLVAAVGVTVVSLVFIVSFIGALHAPGPRSVPTALVGSPAQKSQLSRTLDRAVPGGYDVIRYPSAGAARRAILDRSVDVGVVPAPRRELVLVATAASSALAKTSVKIFGRLAHATNVKLAVKNVRPLPANDPDGLSRIYFVIALLSPSLVFGNMLVTRISRRLHPLLHLVVIAIFSIVIAAVATAFADAVIGGLTGIPWVLFGIGALLAFATAASVAAACRWAGGIGNVVMALLFIPVGIAASGLTLGPNMITQWYSDVGQALPPGAAMTAVNNAAYFNENAIATPLWVLAAWALAGTLAMVMVAILHPPLPGQGTPS